MSMGNATVSDADLKKIKDDLASRNKNKPVRAWMIVQELQSRMNIKLDESTIRGRFIEMGQPLSGANTGSSKPMEKKMGNTERASLSDTAAPQEFEVPEDMKPYIPDMADFENYIERETDRRVAVHFNTGKYPICQGKQGTGKTWGQMYYAAKNKLPFFLFTGTEDFKLSKLFGDKTIVNGTIVFQESLFVKAIQCPSVILFDEINAIPNANTFDFHALLQNRELFIKDANQGKGKLYKLHPECRIGFAQNPKSAKYIGGVVKPSNFLGRCTYITYPEFTKAEIKAALAKRYPNMDGADVNRFTQFHFGILQVIDRANLPVDISIRQLNNTVDLWMAGLPIKEAIEDGMASILDAVSQPKAKDSFIKIAAATFPELINEAGK